LIASRQIFNIKRARVGKSRLKKVGKGVRENRERKKKGNWAWEIQKWVSKDVEVME